MTTPSSLVVDVAKSFRTPLALATEFSKGEWQPARHLAVIDFEFQNLLEDPTLDCLIVKCPVRHGKSEYLARWAPTWYKLRYPSRRIMLTSNTAKLARSHSRWVRDKVHELCPTFGLKGVDPNNASATEWNLDGPGMGGCIAAGVDGSIVGFGADLLIIDDYLKSAKAAYSETVRDAQWDWFVTTSGTRLEPGGKIVLLCCLTGDTKVLRPDGSTTQLKDIKPGDAVSSFANGELVSSNVVNHASMGHDDVFRITLESGKEIRGNARHPFLVETEGRLEWIRLRNLNTDHRILTVNTPALPARSKGARSRPTACESADIITTKRGVKVRRKSRVDGESGEVSYAAGRGAISRQNAEAFVRITTQRKERLTATKRRLSKIQSTTESITCDGDMGSPQRSSTQCLTSRVEFVPYAKSRQVPRETKSCVTCASIIATRQGQSEASFATTAIPQPDTLKPAPPPLSLLNTSTFSSERIVKIEKLGSEEVFDIEVEGTASFVANGMVTHNSAWHEDDLIGRILSRRDQLDMRVRCVTLQALRDSSEGKDPLNRQDGEALWPERWPAEVLERKKKIAGIWWHSIYQGRPKGVGLSSWPASYFMNLWVDEEDWPADMVISASALDPSKGKNAKAGDYQAMVYVGYRGGKLYIDCDMDRRPIPAMVRRYVAFNQERRPALAGIESNAFQELLGDDYSDACWAAGYNADPPALVNNTVNKNLRIERLGKFFAAGMVRFRRTAGCEILLQQLKDFPNGKHDDGPDAMEQAIRLLCEAFDELRGLNEILETAM